MSPADDVNYRIRQLPWLMDLPSATRRVLHIAEKQFMFNLFAGFTSAALSVERCTLQSTNAIQSLSLLLSYIMKRKRA